MLDVTISCLKHDSCPDLLRIGGLEYDVVGMGLHVLVTGRLNLPR